MKTKKKVITIVIPLSFIIFIYKQFFPINMKMSTDVVRGTAVYYQSEYTRSAPLKTIGNNAWLKFNSFYILDTDKTKNKYECFVKLDENGKPLIKYKLTSEKFYKNHKLGEQIPCEYTKITYFNTITHNYKCKYKNFKILEDY